MNTRTMSSALRIAALAGSLSASAFAGVAGCSDPAAPACVAYEGPDAGELAAPERQLQRDVAPILQRSCGFTSCHGSGSGENEGLYLGSDGPRVFAEAVGKPAAELPAMRYVAPGDPASSFLMHKIDGDACILHAQCVGGDCGASMPEAKDPMAINDRDTIRRWIAQGAKND